MGVVYATLIIKGLKKFKELPESVKAEVQSYLVGLELEHLAAE